MNKIIVPHVDCDPVLEVETPVFQYYKNGIIIKEKNKHVSVSFDLFLSIVCDFISFLALS